ncbi:glycosyltransferase [Spiribacter sp. C176]|uniref:Glycosyltransferase n=1 Tax=Spiribacter salilacus TaxID=2664894 RepID=A0A6N7QV69_9GAMM|nr:glycosyltransferase [Spiribacter salilacus]MRH79048.1 glycosyltransferase [Spiribacter salilacus]
MTVKKPSADEANSNELRRRLLETQRAQLAAEQRADDALARLAAAREEVTALRNSASWRVSAPLRWPKLFALAFAEWRAVMAETISRHDGFMRACRAYLAQRNSSNGPQTEAHYQIWLAKQKRLNTPPPEKQPLISVILPVYNPPPELLEQAIDSVRAQNYPRWELCVADDCSTDPAVREVLDAQAAADQRIKVVYRKRNGHISAASNSAIEIAQGDYLALLDHDDLLTADALSAVAQSISAHPDAVILYSDEDRIQAHTGRRIDPYFKSSFNYELLLAQNMISHLGVYRRAEVLAAGGFREGFEGSQDLDLALRVIEQIKPEQVVHIPQVLYHWRAIAGSTALSNDEKGYATGIAARAVGEHLERTGQVAKVEPCYDLTIFQAINYREGAHDLRVTALLQDAAAQPALAASVEDATVNYQPLSPATLTQSKADVLFILDGMIAKASPGALEHLAAWAMQRRVGCVAPRVWSTRRRLDHGGLVFPKNDQAHFVFQDWQRGLYGYGGRAVLHQRYAAMSPFAYAIARETYHELGGLDSRFQSHLAGVDLMLRAHQAGLHNVWLPAASLTLAPGKSRAKANLFADKRIPASDLAYWRERWPNWPAGEGVHPLLSADGEYDLRDE